VEPKVEMFKIQVKRSRIISGKCFEAASANTSDGTFDDLRSLLQSIIESNAF
jgi:hypothetical protein